MFNEIQGEVLDRITLGPKKKPGTDIRLFKTKKGNLIIQIWSNVFSDWKILYRYGDIQKQWDSWKRIEVGINDRKTNRKKSMGTRGKRKSKD